MAGKGSTPRPITDRKQFANNWDNIFSKKSTDCDKPQWVHFCNSGHRYLDDVWLSCDICGAKKAS